MKTKYKVALVVIALAVIAAIVSLVVIKINRKKNCEDKNSTQCQTQLATDTSTSGSSVTATTSKTSEADWKTYKNTGYNFELTFSDVWKGYEVKKPTPTDQAEAKIEFVLNQKYTPLTILVYKTDVWNNTSKDVNHANILGQSGDYTIVYQTWDTPPPELSGITEKEIASVTKTFKVIK